MSIHFPEMSKDPFQSFAESKILTIMLDETIDFPIMLESLFILNLCVT